MKKFDSRAAGFSLIEVMIAVVVLAFGLISLAALQGRLFQSGAESKARAAATSIAQQSLEDARSFAFVTPPTGYTGPTYISLAGGGPWTFNAGGVAFTATRTVKRYRYVDANPADTTPGTFVADADTTNATNNYSGGVPEFKQIDVSVGWTGSDGQPKTVLMTDSIAAMAPADAALLRKRPTGSQPGPKVYVARPSDPQILPIALGSDENAASSNPKPNQVIENVAAATTFSVMTYSGSGDSVLLGRKVDVAAVSCLCQADGNASATAPVYAPVEWNARQQAYLPPQTLVDTSIKKGKVDSTLNNSEIKQMCTVCCRDHHESARRMPRPDPWRVLQDTEKSPSGQEHYGYARDGNGYALGSLLPYDSTNSQSSYVESCQLIRVGGLLRLATDARQANLLVTPLKATTDSGYATDPYDVAGFKPNYETFVQEQIASNIGSVSGGGFPRVTVPADSNLRLQTPISMTDTSPDKKLAAFGLYVDYLSDDTLVVYGCVAGTIAASDTRCKGLSLPSSATDLQRRQAAMGRLPFYAVNVANLGEWKSSVPEAINVSNFGVTNQGSQDGGVVSPNDASAPAPAIPVTLRMNASSSGLASTFPVDPDDRDPDSYTSDKQDFAKTVGEPLETYTVNFVVEQASSINLSQWNYTGGGTGQTRVTCGGRFSVSCTQTYPTKGQVPDMTVTLSGYNSTPDFKVCARSSWNRMVVTVAPPQFSGSATESTGIVVDVRTNASADDPLRNHVLNVYLAVIPQAAQCP